MSISCLTKDMINSCSDIGGSIKSLTESISIGIIRICEKILGLWEPKHFEIEVDGIFILISNG